MNASKGRKYFLHIASLFALLLVLAASPALAVDGVIEISQAASGGFGWNINAAGSYRLTSNLQVAPGSSGIRIFVDNVTVDLNGFTIFGGGGASADGIDITASNIEIRNGTVRSFTRHGVFAPSSSAYVRVIGVKSFNNANSGIELQGIGNIVDGCTSAGNQVGIRTAGEGSLIINSVSRLNTFLGLVMGAGTGYRSNTVTGNNGGDVNPQTTATGIQLGQNLCGTDLVCP